MKTQTWVAALKNHNQVANSEYIPEDQGGMRTDERQNIYIFSLSSWWDGSGSPFSEMRKNPSKAGSGGGGRTQEYCFGHVKLLRCLIK